jgi:hypothetical protein
VVALPPAFERRSARFRTGVSPFSPAYVTRASSFSISCAVVVCGVVVGELGLIRGLLKKRICLSSVFPSPRDFGLAGLLV